MKNSGYTKVIRPKDKTPYQAFVSGVVKPMYDALKLINQLMKRPTNSQLLTKVAATMWNQTILIPAMVYVYGKEVMQVQESEWKKLRNKAEVKTAILHYVQYYLQNGKNLMEFVPLFIEVCEHSGNPIHPDLKPWLPLLVKAKILDVSPLPPLNDKNAWNQINDQFNQTFAT